jgi:hypothetical protein
MEHRSEEHARRAQAIWEAGFFANQNSVGRPGAEEWRYTGEKLKGRFRNWGKEGQGG